MHKDFKGLRLQKFPIRVAGKLGINQYIPNWYYRNYHSKVLGYLEDEYSYLIDKYLRKTNMAEGNIPNRAWIMWWQGMNNAPRLVKRCYESVLRNFEGEVTVITEDNYLDYTSVDKNILEMYRAGKLNATRLSDMIRMNLLNSHGGVWLDATVFLSRKFNLPSSRFYTLKKDNNHFVNISKGLYTSWLTSSTENYLPFEFILEFHYEYFKKESYLIDYLLLDYIIFITYKNNLGGFADDVNNNEYNNTQPYALANNMNNKITSELSDKIFNSGTGIFKLSYKHKISSSSSTYGQAILDGTIVEAIK